MPRHSSDIRTAVAIDCEMGQGASGDSKLIRITLVDYFSSAILIDNLVYPSVKNGALPDKVLRCQQMGYRNGREKRGLHHGKRQCSVSSVEKQIEKEYKEQCASAKDGQVDAEKDSTASDGLSSPSPCPAVKYNTSDAGDRQPNKNELLKSDKDSKSSKESEGSGANSKLDETGVREKQGRTTTTTEEEAERDGQAITQVTCQGKTG
ncbi:uncharacterized protein PADG_12134 [Paracoccidioides brasiliensis Pb18]|uniref:Exonuclease domain-containing protein n=1 Tax=Paracoccidioides brasiliensis (strain Pb18) TaxID=502780 RepID=A0A0A0HT43_PARBD|nr:uncharacterized protein PADG_12134 [Paracoccidioides brasiliensis Pb18]KGM91817.1 hypothetical protein PADG_12134 [Paracoccidioides brasiliensis Pb18]